LFGSRAFLFFQAQKAWNALPEEIIHEDLPSEISPVQMQLSFGRDQHVAIACNKAEV